MTKGVMKIKMIIVTIVMLIILDYSHYLIKCHCLKNPPLPPSHFCWMKPVSQNNMVEMFSLERL